MRWIGLAIIFLSIPMLIAWIGRDMRRRDLAVLAAGALMFCTGPLQITASLVAWPAWQGISKGIILSLLDSIAIALLATRPRQSKRAPFLPLIALFTLPILLSVTQAGVKEAAFFIVFQMLQMTVYFIALAGELRRPAAVSSLMKGLSIGLMIEAGYVISQKLSGVVQAPGTTAHQNILGIMVELSALPLIAAVLEGKQSKLVYAGLFAALIVIAGGGSRGTMLYFSVGVAIVLFLSLARHATPRKWQIFGLGVLALAITAPLAYATLKDRFGNTEITTEEDQRAAFERAARAMAADHPLGVGANNFVTVDNLQGYADRAGLTWGSATRSKPVHNAYLVARAETGWAGEIGLILLMGALAFAGIKIGFRMRKAQHLGYALGGAGAIIAVAFHSNYEYAWYLADTQRLFFTNAALIAGCMAMAKQGKARPGNPKRPGHHHALARRP
jgi:hypothetical protein